jgi:glutathione S-transferase
MVPEIFAKFQFGLAVGSTVTAELTRRCAFLLPGTMDERRPTAFPFATWPALILHPTTRPVTIMKLINSFGPNPRLVRMFMAEKGIQLPTEELDLLAGENRKPPYTDKNPGGQMPALQLDDGTVIAETAAICEYLEECHPSPALIGSNAKERAIGRMWQRRVELNITENIYNGFRYAEGLGLFKDRMYCIPEAADGLKAKGKNQLAWLDGLMNGRDFVGGNSVGLADITLYCCLDFAKGVGQPIPPELKNINAWFQRMDQRPSAQQSLSPGWEQVGMRG